MEVIAQTATTTTTTMKPSKANSTQCNSNDVITSSTNPSPKDKDIQHNNNNMLSPVVVVPTCKSKKGPYTLGVTLGEGAFAKVKLATHNIIKEKIAIKIIDKFKLLKDETDIQRIKREISILKKIRHNNIIQLYEIMESKHNLYIVMEYCEGKELFDYIVKHKRLNEKDACILFQQLISGVDYLHKQGIIHRDLKPENILLDANNNLKLSDFGLSTFDTHNHLLKTPCGTPTYAPPEMLRGDEYNGECSDIWSCGVILYAMLCGALPYVESKEEVILHKIIHKEFTLPSFLSRQAVDLINKMLTNEPKDRISIKGIIKHPWFNIVKPKLYCGLDLNKVEPPVDEHILEEVKLYGYDGDKCRECVMNNKYDTLTAVYYLLVRKHVANGGSSISDLQSKEFVNYVKEKEIKNKNVNESGNGSTSGNTGKSAECGKKKKQIVKCNNGNSNSNNQKHVKKKSIDLAKVTTTNKELRLSNHYVNTKININNNHQNAPLPLYANSPCSKRVHTKVKSDFTGSFAGSLSNTTHAREIHLAKQMLSRKKRQDKTKGNNNNHNTNTQSMSHNNNNNDDLQYINRELIGNSFGSFDISVHPITTSIPNNNNVVNHSTNRNNNSNRNSNRSSKANLINHSRFNGNKKIKHSFVMKKEVFIYDTNPHYKHRKSKHQSNNHKNKFLDISTTQLDASIERSTSINNHHSSKSPDLRKLISPNKEDTSTSPFISTRKPINTLNTNCIQIIEGTSPTKSNCVNALQKCKNKLKPSTTTSNPANPNINKKCTISLMKASAPKQTHQHYISNNINNTKYQTINASSSTSSAGHSKAKTSKKNSFGQKNELSARPQPKLNILHQGESNNNEAKSKNNSIEIIFKHTRTGSACDSLSQTKKRIQINFNEHGCGSNNNNNCNNSSSHMNTEIDGGLTHVAVVPTPKQSIIDIINVHEPHKSSRNSYGSGSSSNNHSVSVHKSFVFPQCKLKVVDMSCVVPISKQVCLNVIVNTIYEWLKKEKITHTKFNKTNNIKCSKTNLHFEIELFVLVKDECVYLKPKHRQGDVALFRKIIQSLITIINNKIININ